jgi:phosphatidylglycerol---prolipoprotein diacylglyceryl transferase
MPNPEAFHIGPFTIGGFTIDIPVHWYGIMIMLGVLAATYMSFREAKRRGQDPDHVWQLFPWVLVAGILGARIGWVISEANSFQFRDFWQIFAVQQGGLSIQGAIVGGVLAVVLYCLRYKLSFFLWADIIVPGLALAQAIGRWGNYFNQEAFGRPTTLPWGIPIDVSRQVAVAGPNPGFTPSSGLRFHPTFAYEMIWDLLNFGLLMWLGRQRRIKLIEGDLLWVYLIVYSVGRYAIEEIRVDSATVSGFKTPQLVAIITILIALVAIVLRHRPGSRARLATNSLPESVEAAEPTDAEEAAAIASGATPRASRVRRVARQARSRG